MADHIKRFFCSALLLLNGASAGADLLFAGTFSSGIFRSSDLGASWTSVGPDLENISVLSLAVGADGYLFAGTDDEVVFRSADGGTNWHRVAGGLERTIRRFAVRSDGHLFAATSGGLYQSADNGGSWERTGFSDDVDVVHLLPDGTLFIGTEHEGLLRSTDGGATWSHLLDPGAMVMSLTSDALGYVFAGVTVVFRSKDLGQTWAPLLEGPVGSYVLALAVDPDGRMFASTLTFDDSPHRIFRSDDAGDNWTEATGGVVHPVSAFAFASDGRSFIGTAGYDDYEFTGQGGVLQSFDHGDGWTPTSLTGVDVLSLAIQSESPASAVENKTWGSSR